MRGKGFTLIELLIVVALIGILAVALLSAINPVEQMKKARDAGKKSDAAELLNAYERYYSTYGCYPWNSGAAVAVVCGTIVRSTVVNPVFTSVTGDARLLPSYGGVNYSAEIKPQFTKRDSVTNTNVNKRLWVSETADGRVSVCFEPESQNARLGGLGTLQNQTNTATTTITCTGTYPSTTCYVCVPQ